MENPTKVTLTMEQEFNIRSFKDQISTLTREQAIEFLGDLYRQMVIKEAMYKNFLKQAV